MELKNTDGKQRWCVLSFLGVFVILLMGVFYISVLESCDTRVSEVEPSQSLAIGAPNPWLQEVYATQARGCLEVRDSSFEQLLPDDWPSLRPYTISAEMVFHLHDQGHLPDSMRSIFIDSMPFPSTTLEKHYQLLLKVDDLETLNFVDYAKEASPLFDQIPGVLDHDFQSFREFYPASKLAARLVDFRAPNLELAETSRLLAVWKQAGKGLMEGTCLDFDYMDYRAYFLYLDFRDEEMVRVNDTIAHRYSQCPKIMKSKFYDLIRGYYLVDRPESDSMIALMYRRAKNKCKTANDWGAFHRSLGEYFATTNFQDSVIFHKLKASQYYEEARQYDFVYEQSFGLSNLYRQKKQYLKANQSILKLIRNYHQDFEIQSSRDIAPAHLINPICLRSVGFYARNLSDLYQKTGDPAYFQESLELYQIVSQSLALSANHINHQSKTQLMGHYQDIFNHAVLSLSQEYTDDPQEEHLELIFSYMELARSNIQMSRAVQRGCLKYDVPEALCIKEKILLDEYLWHCAEDLSQTDVMKSLKDYERRLIQLSDTLRIYSPKYYQLRYKNYDTKLSEVIDLAQRENIEILKYLWTSDPRSGEKFQFGIFISPDTTMFSSLNPSHFDLHKAAMDSLLFYSAVEDSYFAQLTDSLREALLRPFIPHMSEHRPLIIVPQGVLSNIAFELLTPAQKVVSYAYSTKELVFKFDSDERPSTQRYLGVFSESKTDQNTSLWQSKPEVAMTSAHFQKERMLSASRTKKEDLFHHMERADLIHIALHGEVVEDQDAFIHMHNGEEEIVRFSDIEMLDMPGSLVVLSSCYGNKGFFQSPEGAESIANSFHLAGAMGVVSSIWEVQDISAKYIIPEFFKLYSEGLPPNEALASAKKHYLNHQKDPLLKSPKYWAGFQYHGAF